MKKIGLFLSIIALTLFFSNTDVNEPTDPEHFNDPGYGDID